LYGPPIISPAQDGAKTNPVTIQVVNGGTPSARVCYSTNGADINATCSGGTGITCQNNIAAGALVVEFADQATNLDVKARACKTNPPTSVSASASTQTSKSYSFTPYSRTINITDGFDDWSSAQNGLPVEVDPGNNVAYLSWDNDTLYFGWRGAELLNSTTRYFNVYLKGGTGSYTTTQDDRLGATKFGPATNGNRPQVPGGVNHHFFVRTDRNEAAGASLYDGANWTTSTVAIACGSGGGALATATALVECSVPRAAVGLTGAATLSFSGNLSDTAVAPPGITQHSNFPWTGVHSYWTGSLTTNIPSDATRWQTGAFPAE